MKNIALLLLAIILQVVIGCSSEDNSLETNEDTSSNLIISLNNIIEENSQNENFMEYDLYSNEDGTITIISESTIERNFTSEFAQAYDKGSNTSVSVQMTQRGPVTVCCSMNGENQGCATCPSGEGQGGCVASLITACLSDGGCGTVCPQRMVYDPTQREFIITRK